MAFWRKKKSILVADDDKDFLSVTRAILEFEGFKVDTVENGEDALKKVKRHTYDLLILDVIMPKVDGVKLFHMARKSKRYADIPILFISGSSSRKEFDEEKRETVKKADAYIQKPFNTRAFMEKVKTLMRQ